MNEPLAETAPPSRRKQLVAGAVTLITLIIVFGGILPQLADYGEAWEAIQGMSAGWLIVLIGATLINIIVYVWPYQAALPGMRFGPAFVVRNTSFAISNGVPGGGAFGLGVQYTMLGDYGVTPGGATAAIAVTSLWNTLVTLGLPVLAVLIVLTTGEFEPWVAAVAAVGTIILGAIIALLTMLFRRESLARRLGDWGSAVVGRLARLIRKDVDLELVNTLVGFRASTVDLVKSRSLRITATNTFQQVMQFGVLFIALRAIEQSTGVEITFAEAFVAFAIGRLASFIPVTPGGLGTVDAAITGILVALGALESNALAATLVWRAATFFPQILIGVATFLYWRRRRGKASFA